MNNIAKRRSYQELTSLRTSYSKRETTSFSKKEIYRADLGSRERKSYNELRTSRDLSACRNIRSCNDMVGYKEYANNREKRSMSQSREKRQSYHELKGSYNELKGNYNELKGSYNELNRGSYNELSTCKGSQEYLPGSFQNLRNMKEKRERRSCQDVTNLVDLGSSTNLSSFMEKGSCEELAAENWKIKMFLESTEVIYNISCMQIFFWGFSIHGMWSFCMSRLMTKRTKWHVRPAKTQISLGIHPV